MVSGREHNVSGEGNSARTSSCVEPPSTTVALEVLCLLMRDQELQIFKVSLAVVTPWSRQELLDIGLLSLLLAHLRDFVVGAELESDCRRRDLRNQRD